MSILNAKRFLKRPYRLYVGLLLIVLKNKELCLFIYLRLIVSFTTLKILSVSPSLYSR
jgi:hypothetical protein